MEAISNNLKKFFKGFKKNYEGKDYEVVAVERKTNGAALYYITIDGEARPNPLTADKLSDLIGIEKNSRKGAASSLREIDSIENIPNYWERLTSNIDNYVERINNELERFHCNAQLQSELNEERITLNLSFEREKFNEIWTIRAAATRERKEQEARQSRENKTANRVADGFASLSAEAQRKQLAKMLAETTGISISQALIMIENAPNND